MPEPQLLRMTQIDFVGFVEEGANQEDGEGAYIKIWKRAKGLFTPSRRKTMSDVFDTKDLSEDAQKAFADLEEARKEAEDKIEAAETAQKDTAEKLEKSEADLAEAKGEDPPEGDVLKGLPDEVRKVLDARQEKADEAIAKALSEAEAATKAAEAASEVAKAEREKRERREFAEIAKNDMGDLTTKDLGDQLYEASQVMSDEAFETYTTTLRATSAQAKAADAVLFKELGAGGGGTSGDAWAEVQSKAREMVEKKLAPTEAQAIDKVLQDHPELYERYQAEQAKA